MIRPLLLATTIATTAAISLAPFSLGPGTAHGQAPTASPSTRTTPPKFEKMARQTVRQWLIPTYERFISKAATFDAAVTKLCGQAGQSRPADAAALQGARQALKELQLAWAAASLIKFGPINKQTRLYRVYFWPDKHGTGARQFRKALAAKDYERLKPKAFAEQSAALQGLGPAEKLLYPSEDIWRSTQPSDGKTRAYSCAMLHAIDANLETIGKETIAIWQQRLAAPAAAKKAVAAHKYDNRDELYYKFIKALIDESELSSFVRLGKVMGASPEQAKPKLAEAYRQTLSIPLIKASLAAMHSLLLGDGNTYPGLIKPFATPNLRANAEQRFADTRKALDAIKGPLGEAVKKDWQSVRTARFAMNDLVTYLTETIALKAGIVFTFNALDGD